MHTKHPLYYILPGAVIALTIILLLQQIGSGSSAKQFWVFLIAMLGASILGLAVLLFHYSNKLKGKRVKAY